MADTSQVEDGSDYRSDILTNLGSEIFRSTTSKKTDQTLPIARKTRNIGTRRGEVLKVSRQNLSRRIRPAKNPIRSKQWSIFYEQYLHVIGTQRPANDHAPLKGIPSFLLSSSIYAIQRHYQ